MKLHIHIGPGHHEKILLEQLTSRKIEFSSSNYYPKYSFLSENGKVTSSLLYNTLNKIVWLLASRIGIRKNKIIDFTYPIYDYVTSKRIKNVNLLFCWPQVSLRTMKRIKSKNKTKIVLDYPIPHVLTWQNILIEEGKLYNSLAHSVFSKAMVNRMLKEIELADFVSIPSEFVKRSFVDNGVPNSKLILNSYGIDSNQFRPNHKTIDSSSLRVIFIGSIEIRKGVHYLLEAFSKLPESKFELILIGTISSDIKKIISTFEVGNKITFVGQKSKLEIVDILNQSDVMVMPSLLEGLSLTILEAMSCEVPVISSENAGGLGVIDDGEDGFIIPIRDADSIANKLIWCQQNKKTLRLMGINARKKIIQNYDINSYGDRFVDRVYNSYEI